MLNKLCFISFVSLFILANFAQDVEPEKHNKLEDLQLDLLEGQWRMQGSILGESVTYSLDSKWVLGHQFMLLHMCEISNPPQYEAFVYIGFDSSKGQYVVHWLDHFGGRPSLTLGYGKPHKSKIQFLFDYPSGQFRDTFTYDNHSNQWHFLIESKAGNGNWTVFADYQVQKKKLEN